MRFCAFVLLTISFTLTAAAENFTVVSYNIWNGFNKGSAVQPGIAWIKAQDAHVVALQELVGIDATGLAKFAEAWNHPHSAILKERGYPVGITSRTPIEVVERRMEGMHHGFLHARTAGYDIFVLHLAPGDDRLEVRKREVNILTEILTPLVQSGTPLIALGDFNDVSPLDISDKDRDVSVIQGFLTMGLVDTVHHFAKSNGRSPRGTYPTRTFTPDVTQQEHEAKIRRIDYIFVTEELNKSVEFVESPRHPDLDIVSDHYPVVLRFNRKVIAEFDLL